MLKCYLGRARGPCRIWNLEGGKRRPQAGSEPRQSGGVEMGFQGPGHRANKAEGQASAAVWWPLNTLQEDTTMGHRPLGHHWPCHLSPYFLRDLFGCHQPSTHLHGFPAHPVISAHVLGPSHNRARFLVVSDVKVQNQSTSSTELLKGSGDHSILFLPLPKSQRLPASLGCSSQTGLTHSLPPPLSVFLLGLYTLTASSKDT